MTSENPGFYFTLYTNNYLMNPKELRTNKTGFFEYLLSFSNKKTQSLSIIEEAFQNQKGQKLVFISIPTKELKVGLNYLSFFKKIKNLFAK